MYSKNKPQGPDGLKVDDKNDKPHEDGVEDLRKANENIRKAQGDDSTEPPADSRQGNRPRFDRDR